MSDLPVTTIVGLAAFAAGTAFGWTARRTEFCAMGAVSDVVALGDWRRFRAWMLAVAAAILSTQTLVLAGLADLSKSFYLSPNLGWPGAILGGLAFGFGMTHAGGCGNKILVRLGGGNLKSLLVVLVVGLFSYMTIRGLIAPARLALESANLSLAGFGLASQGAPDLLVRLSGLSPWTARALLAFGFGGGLALWCLKDAGFRRSPAHWGGGLALGLLVGLGWAITVLLGADEFEPVPAASFTFIAPIGMALQYLMTFTGSTIDFGVAAVGGVIFGAFLAAKATGSFRLEAFDDAADMVRHLAGAALMGTGGALALGCTIGQGLTGMSTLALSSPLALGAIVAGAVLGLKRLEES